MAEVYDALVRLAQDFARQIFCEGQEIFGNIDGDNAAAMRYTEARLTEYAIAMLEGSTRTRSIFVDMTGPKMNPFSCPAVYLISYAMGRPG